MNVIYTILGVLLIFALGYEATLLMRWRGPILERLGLAFGLGVGFLTLLMFFISAAGIVLSMPSVFTITLVLMAVLYFPFKRRIDLPGHLAELRKELSSMKLSFSAPEAVFLILLALLLMSNVLLALYWPVWDWDSLTLYDRRARVIAAERSIEGIPSDYMEYPMLLSLGHAWLYICHIGDNPQLIYALFFLSMVAIFYFQVRRYTTRFCAQVFTFLMVSTPIFFERACLSHSQTPHAFYFTCGTLYLFYWMKESKTADLLVAGLLLGLAGWVRPANEPFYMANLVVLAIFCLPRKKIIPLLLVAVLCFLPTEIWKVYIKYVKEFKNPVGMGIIKNLLEHPTINWNNLGTVLAGLLFHVRDVTWHGLVWIPFAVVLITNHRYLKENLYMLLFVVLFLGAWIGTYYLGSMYRGQDHFLSMVMIARGSGSRMLIAVIPLFLYYCAIMPVTRDLFESIRRFTGGAPLPQASQEPV